MSTNIMGIELDKVTVPDRPTSRQEVVREWILFLPLTTAVFGSAMVQTAPAEYLPEFLPAIFFLGALIVTSAMLHQRHTYQLMLSLAERAHSAYSRLDTLHGLAQELNKPLHTVQVGQAVTGYALRFLEADEGAFWLRRDLLPGGPLRGLDAEDGGDSTPLPASSRWSCIAARGFELEERQALLQGWTAALERGHGLTDVLQWRVAPEPGGATELGEVVSVTGSAVSLPIIWEGECVGVMLINSRRQLLRRDDVTFLTDIRLATGPALQNAFQFQAATERAEIDGLTKLYNHRAIQERAMQEVARVSRERHHNRDVKLSVAMMDLTDFKLFNDSYGHAMGDEVLRSVGDCMRRLFRSSDIVGRYGGDEFLALLPDTDHVGARALCERIIETLRSTVLTSVDGSPISIRLACGVAAFPPDGQSADELLAIADERLYAAKVQGVLLVPDEAGAAPPPPPVHRPDWGRIGLLDSIVTAIDQKDHYTRQHCETVWTYASLLAARLDLAPDLLEAVEVCSLVFDVGKIVLPHELLRKPGRLTPDEHMVLQQHPVFGALIVRDVPHLDVVLGGVRHHHECFDGSGYPDQLKGHAIPLVARIIAVADSFAAMTSERPYQPRMAHERALEEIARGAGQQFDPAMVTAFDAVIRDKLQLGPSVSVDGTGAGSESSRRATASAVTATTGVAEHPTVRAIAS